jgi:hypothetical protein
MSNVGVTSLELRAIDSILEMGGGYVLDFSDPQFSAVLREVGVNIDDARYRVDGTSKARRLRCFLRSTGSPLAGRVLAHLLEHRLSSKPTGLNPTELESYRLTTKRLGGVPPAAAPTPKSSEDELLALVFRPELFRRFPFESSMIDILVARLAEARRCIEGDAHLSAVILCGSVLEGMCLSIGVRDPERVNRGYIAVFSKSPPKLPDWKLREWIDVLGHLGFVLKNVQKFGHAVRDFRNYVHPLEQLANGFAPDLHTARISFQVVIAAAEDLLKALSVPT